MEQNPFVCYILHVISRIDPPHTHTPFQKRGLDASLYNSAYHQHNQILGNSNNSTVVEDDDLPSMVLSFCLCLFWYLFILILQLNAWFIGCLRLLERL